MNVKNWAIEMSRKHVPDVGEANLYAVVIYSDAQPHISKVVNDEHYWKALDEISGNRWIIFAARTARGCVVESSSSQHFGHLGRVIEVGPEWKEPSTNRDFLEAFGLNSTQYLPLFVLFTEGDKDEIDCRHIRLSEKSVESAWESLMNIVKTINNAIEGMEDQYRRVESRAFEVACMALNGYQGRVRIVQILEIWRWLRSL